jgi:hypothetical protein
MASLNKLGGKMQTTERDCPRCSGKLHFYLGQVLTQGKEEVPVLKGGHLEQGKLPDGGPCTLINAYLHNPGEDEDEAITDSPDLGSDDDTEVPSSPDDEAPS